MRLRAHPGVIGLTRTQRFVWWRLTMNEHAKAFQIALSWGEFYVCGYLACIDTGRGGGGYPACTGGCTK